MAKDLTFEPAREADGAMLLALARAFHLEDGHPLDAAGERAVLALAAGEPMARAWLLRQGGEAVGYFALTFGWSIEHGGRDGFLEDLYVVPPARGAGVGRRALAFALEQAAALGIRMLHLEIEPDNAVAERLYLEHGFRPSRRRLMSVKLAELSLL